MESTIVLQGFYSQKIVTGAFISRGIQSATFVAPVGTTSAVCYAWLCRPAAGSNIIVELYDVTTPAVVASALYDTAGWDTETAKDGIRIFKRVEVSSAAGIVAGRTYRMRIYNTVNTGATYYVDKCYWKWGTTVVPDEWCDHWLIYNHYDTTEGAAHVGHQNYFDVADLKGTDEARLGLQVQEEVAADLGEWGDLIVARRSWWDSAKLDPVRDVHWIEGEDASSVSNWAAAVLARCSAGRCIANAANVSGYGQWTLFAASTPGAYWTSQFPGRWDVFGVVYNDDVVNTQYRLSYTGLGFAPWFYNQWVKQTLASTWQMVYLGEVHLERFMMPGYCPAGVYIRVEYAKDAPDTVRLDCLWLLPKAEPESRLHLIGTPWLTAAYGHVIDRTTDFDCDAIEFGISLFGSLSLQGDLPTLLPGQDQRLYFSAESIDIAPMPDEREWEAHGAATNLQWRLDIAYLPQYQTPLD
jgi:hypothetical protein